MTTSAGKAAARRWMSIATNTPFPIKSCELIGNVASGSNPKPTQLIRFELFRFHQRHGEGSFVFLFPGRKILRRLQHLLNADFLHAADVVRTARVPVLDGLFMMAEGTGHGMGNSVGKRIERQ